MGIGEAEAFSERLKRELLALEAANVHAILESEPLIDEVILLLLVLCIWPAYLLLLCQVIHTQNYDKPLFQCEQVAFSPYVVPFSIYYC